MSQSEVNLTGPTEEASGECAQIETTNYGQTKRSLEFTSENHKVEVSNLPQQTKYHLIRHMIEHHFKLKPRKIRAGRGVAFLAFKSESERDQAIERINQKEYKGRLLEAKPAAPRDDLLAKRFCSKLSPDEAAPECLEKQSHHDESTTVTDDDVNSTVCPLWMHPYEKQLKIKDSSMRSVLNIGKQLMKAIPGLKRDHPRLYEWVQSKQGVCCEYAGIEPSPVISHYRNKCEFNIGSDGTIGFKMGRYKNGSDRVISPPANCPIVNETMLKIIECFQFFIQKSGKTKLTGFNHVAHEGNLRQLTIRLNQSQDYLIIVDLHPQDLSTSELDDEIKLIADIISSIDKVKSIYVNVSEKLHMSGTDKTLKHVFGQSYLYESLNVNQELKFRIGPSSFFQINTKGAELLYKSIIDIAQLNSNSLVLDIGCGTGTIGLSIAKLVRFVIGIEIVESAIEDAKINAKENEIDNVLYFAGKAEDLIGETIRIMAAKQDNPDEDSILAIVDPPRIGFNSSFIKHLRASKINKIVYVACDPKANTNLMSLCRPRSKAYQGEPFIPTKAKAFDLFPHTKYCELVIVYERLKSEQKDSSS